MRMRLLVGTATVALALAFGTAPTAVAQDGESLSKKEAKKLLKKSEKDLKKAREAGKHAEEARRDAEKHVIRYTENLEQLNRALSSGNLDQGDLLEVAARVDEATLKHVPVLEGLLETVPEEAKPAIERALEVSRTGHETATEAILNHGQVSLPAGLLTDQAARDAMEKNEVLLKHAERAQKRGDNAAVGRSVEQYTANIDAVSHAIEIGTVDEWEAVSVLDRVDRNTRRHLGVLEGLLGKVPEQARPDIERAIQVSQRGNRAAVEALSRTPAAGVLTGRPGAVGSPAGVGGRPGGVAGGKPGGKPSGKPGGPPQ